MAELFIQFPSTLIPTGILILSIMALAIIIDRFYFIFYLIANKGRAERKTRFIQSDDETKNGFFDNKDLSLQKLNIYNKCLHILDQCQYNSKARLDILADENMMQLSNAMKKRLMALGTISSVAPLAGLLGTVTGMIKSFHAFSEAGIQNQQLMGGVDEALVTTAMGLMVGIPALIFYNIFANKINSLLNETRIVLEKIINHKNRSNTRNQ